MAEPRTGPCARSGPQPRESPRLWWRLRTLTSSTRWSGSAARKTSSPPSAGWRRARDIFSADLGYPIIMTRSGDVLDGAHRVAKAYLQGERTIAAVVIDDYPPPDGVVD